MPDPANPAGPEEQPVVAGADDVDRLLEEAQSLAAQIASGTGPNDGTTPPPPVTPEVSAEEKDALGAAEDVEKTLAELEGILGTKAAKPATAAGTEKDSDTAPTPPATSGKPLTKPTAPRGKNEILDLPADAEFASNVMVDLGSDAPARPQQRSAAKPDRSRTAPAEQSGRALLTTILAAGRTTGPALGRFIAATVAAIATTLDRPFARLSPATKQHIGYVAIITILAAIASFVMPPLLDSNPYLKIGAPTEAPVEAVAPAHE